jgi:hypothetical protein
MGGKHTPGPWFSEGTRIAAMDGPTVIDCMGNMGGEDVAADMRLIVAAPELLAAAIHFEGCTYFQDNDGLDGCPLCAKHRETIAKAQGGA